MSEQNGFPGSRGHAHIGPSDVTDRLTGQTQKCAPAPVGPTLNGNTDTRGLVGNDEREHLASGFGSKLRELRKASGLSQDRLSKLAGIGVTHLSRLEHGRRRPSVDAIKSLARVLRGPDDSDAVERKLALLAGDSLREGAARRKRHRENKHRREAASMHKKHVEQVRRLLQAKERAGLPVSDSLRAMAASDVSERLAPPAPERGIRGVTAKDARRPSRITRPKGRSLKDIEAWLRENGVEYEPDDEDS